VVTPMVDILMKLFRNMVNVKMPFHLTLLSVCFCNLKKQNTAKKGPIDYYLSPSLSATSHSGKRSFVSTLLIVQFYGYTHWIFVVK
jgi:DNA polymerase iota